MHRKWLWEALTSQTIPHLFWNNSTSCSLHEAFWTLIVILHFGNFICPGVPVHSPLTLSDWPLFLCSALPSQLGINSLKLRTGFHRHLHISCFAPRLWLWPRAYPCIFNVFHPIVLCGNNLDYLTIRHHQEFLKCLVVLENFRSNSCWLAGDWFSALPKDEGVCLWYARKY